MATSVRSALTLMLAGALVMACNPAFSGRRPDGGRTGDAGDAGRTSGCMGIDSDGNGIDDSLEYADNADDDGDGLSDAVEAGMTGNICAPQNSDGDDLFDFLDTDSDNDGLSDRDEAASGTDPTDADTDGDGFTDLAEDAAGTDSMDPASRIPDTDFFVVLPYNGAPVDRNLDFGTNLQQADVYFLIDTTGSMQGAINDVNSSLMSIAATVSGLISDVQFGVGHYRDFPTNPYGWSTTSGIYIPTIDDAPYYHLVDITADLGMVNAALALDADGGNDEPESSTEAIYMAASGMGITYARDGSSAATIPDRTCPSPLDGEGMGRGYPCFRPGSLPILVVVSDANWHEGSQTFYDYSGIPTARGFTQAVDAMNGIGARMVGVNLGASRTDMDAMARATGSVDGTGATLVFDGAPSSTSMQIINGIRTLVGGTPQDVSTTRHNVPGVNPDDFDATLFIKSIVPVDGFRPDGSSGGFDRMDETTFYQVTPGTIVRFQVHFWNDVRMPASVAQIFQARIVVLGNGVARLDERRVFIIVPPEGGTILI
jgi:hypothetical protein